MRIALHKAAVHECAGVALIPVGDDILDITGGIVGELPLLAGGETRPPTASQPGLGDFLDDRLGLHRERLAQRLITADGDRLLDGLRIDHATVAQHYTHLLAVERNLVIVGHSLVSRGFLIRQPLDNAAFDQRFLHHVRHVGHIHLAIQDAVGLDDDHGPFGAKTPAARLNHPHLARQVPTLQLFHQSFLELGSSAL